MPAEAVQRYPGWRSQSAALLASCTASALLYLDRKAQPQMTSALMYCRGTHRDPPVSPPVPEASSWRSTVSCSWDDPRGSHQERGVLLAQPHAVADDAPHPLLELFRVSRT
eukprot:jgi/Botrbrau1/2705/Bobra.0203s0047.1